MSDKTLRTRIQHKRGTANDWSQATNFVPLDGELIIYNEKNGTSPKFKVGDGTTLVGNLPFVTSEQTGGGTVSGNYLPLAGGTLTGALNINADTPAYWVRKNDALIGGMRGLLDSSNQHRLALQQNASGSTYGEVYYLPTPDVLATGGASYNILTTKNLVSIAQGGTGANNTRDAINNLGLRVVPYIGSDDYADITDLNELTLSGLFQVAGDFINAPHASPCFILNVKGTNDRTTQFGWRSKTTTAAKNIYMRRKLDGVWDDWQIIAGPNLAVNNYLPLAGGTMTGQLNIEPEGSTVPLRLKTSNIDVSNFDSNVGQYAVQVLDANASTVGYSQVARNTAGYVEYRHGAYLGANYNDTGANKTTYLYARVKKDGSTETGTNSIFYGAVWNDYAEFRLTVPEVKPGQVVVENGDGTLSISTERLQAGCEVVSDTYGFAIGKTKKAETPIAVSGRVLAYTYEDRNTFVAGEPVCSGPNGTVSRMTREEAKEYPERIIGTVSEIPEYEVWGEEEVAVNGRIWIRIK